ncbi:aconitate hydratase AcnA [Rhodobacteraceae bacterium]|nr:aconitate hydratase AcnA [Paracoccaceae bacterium]
MINHSPTDKAAPMPIMPADILHLDGEPHAVRPLHHALKGTLPDLPYVLRLLAENSLGVSPDGRGIAAILAQDGQTIRFRPSRLILQDMLALPLLLDLMLVREEVAMWGSVAGDMDISLPVDLIIDHSMTVEHWACADALAKNQTREFEVNRERFAFFKACEAQFEKLRVIPPGGGIMHQVNLEYLSCVTERLVGPGMPLLQADTVLGTDSHTPMVNGLGVLGWGIGGLDAERIIFGAPLTLNVPEVVGLRLKGKMPLGTTATDIALKAAQVLREAGVIGAFIELCGDGYATLSVPDRATIANMAPEYGATCLYCPIDEATLDYLKMTGRPSKLVKRVEAWARHQKCWRLPEEADAVIYDRVVDLDMNLLGRSLAGPSRPEQHIPLQTAPQLADALEARHAVSGADFDLGHDDVIIAAITSCTNTANPRNMVTAGLLARKAVARGLRAKPWVKTSLSPGSRVVAAYLRDSGLLGDLETLGFHLTGFACTTCNGMSGPLTPEIEQTITDNDLNCAAVLSGNRNFAGRIHPLAAKNVLAAPPLVVAYAIAGSLHAELSAAPLGYDAMGAPTTLDDLWPSEEEIGAILDAYAGPGTYRDIYNKVSEVSSEWTALGSDGAFSWPEGSTYITRPPFLDGVPENAPESHDIVGARALVVLGDNITTDHISPAGYIPADSAAGAYLLERGVARADFNSFGTRRGSNAIVERSTFSSIRLQNELVPEREGSWTRVFPSGQVMKVFEAVRHYRSTHTPLIVIAGKSYGGGSSRDTAAKAPKLAGVRAVLAESFERIHRSNLISMGIAPLEFPDGLTRRSLKLGGSEVFGIRISEGLETAILNIIRKDGIEEEHDMILRLDNAVERETFRHGGALPEALRQQLAGLNAG